MLVVVNIDVAIISMAHTSKEAAARSLPNTKKDPLTIKINSVRCKAYFHNSATIFFTPKDEFA